MSNRSKQFRNALLGASAMISAAALATSATAADARQVTFDMPAQPLTTALKAFGAAADQQLIFSERLVDGRSAPALKGDYSPDQALAMLLAGSGLTAERTPGGVVTIRSASQDPQGGSADGAGAEVEALIVTAQKREEDIQDVPIAISAFTQEALERSQVAGGPDLMTQVPNMTFTKTNFSSYSIQIRGIGTQAISATTDAAVAVAFNNTPFIRNRFFEQEFYDLQRVEVLRGPQGTLYGRNATAGVVNIISAKPAFGYEARLSADVANYNSTRLEGMLNIPLAEDVVALRIAGAWTKREGYSTNEITAEPIDGRDLWSTRVSLRLAPTERLEANLIWEHFEEDDDRLRSGKQLCRQDDRAEISGYRVPSASDDFRYSNLFSQGCLPASLYSPDSFEAPNGESLPYYLPLELVGFPATPGFYPYTSLTQSNDLRVIESTIDPTYKAESDLVELQLRLDLNDALTLASETGYSSDFIFSTQDFNRFNTASGAFTPRGVMREGLLEEGEFGAVFCDPQLGCADRLVAMDLSTARSRQFSQELRLSSESEGPFNFSLGANFLRYDTEDKYYVFINTLTLWSAQAPYSGRPSAAGMGEMPPWIPGVSDNRECLLNGFREPDPAGLNTLQGCVYIDPNPVESLTDLGHNYFLSRNPYKLISYAVFGEAYYNITEALKVTAGLRWTVDKKDAPRIPSWVLASGTVGYPVLEVIEQEWREPTGRLTVDWKPRLSFTDETLLYASYARGYKAGGANPPPAGVVVYEAHIGQVDTMLNQSALKPRTFDPEIVNAYEVGTKNTLLDGQLTFNANAFYYDYQGYQVSQIIDRSAVNYNFDAEVWGLEIEADWRPLENLRLGFKGGHQRTRMGDDSRAIDIMDRTAERTDWAVIRPFPVQTSNCVLPIYTLIDRDDPDALYAAFAGGNPGPCAHAYISGIDPVTFLPYVPDPEMGLHHPGPDYSLAVPIDYGDYPGFNPALDYGNNRGEGFFKDLSGNELPNAPHYTATITADYTLPLPQDWLATLHTDVYYQSEAWTRVFNTEGYDKLKAYTNVNVAAIFTNEDAGWKVMAYVKNVFDRDSITGAFLNSDDTGLTTNVFLTEPRLYGLRVTKEWNGGPWWTGASLAHEGPFPLTVEIRGQMQRNDAPYATLRPDFADAFSSALDTIDDAQNRDLDRGDAREVGLIYRPAGSPWTLSARARYGRANGGNVRLHTEETGDLVCGIPEPFQFVCDPSYPNGAFYDAAMGAPINRSDTTASQREAFDVVDFAVGRDVGIGPGDLRSSLSAGVRYAEFESRSTVGMDGVADYIMPEGWKYMPGANPTPAEVHFDLYRWTAQANRAFSGAGPVISWAAAKNLWSEEGAGTLAVDWSVAAGVLFGKQRTQIAGVDGSYYWSGKYFDNPRGPDEDHQDEPFNISRSRSTAVPLLDVSAGLSYEVQRLKISAGYRWERYFDVLDGGFEEAKDVDRTIDGPYFKIAVGFGG